MSSRQPRSREEIVQALKEEILRQPGERQRQEQFSSGWPALDQILPGGALERGMLVEWLADERGNGAGTLALHAAREACREGGTLVVLDRSRQFYPPAALAAGIELDQLVLVRAARRADDAWALDQALRCPGVGAVLCWPEKLDDRTFRRLQLAAESSGTVGLLVRPAAARRAPSWAQLRLLVTPLPAPRGIPAGATRRLRVEVLYCRGANAGQAVELNLERASARVAQSRRTSPARKRA